MGQWLRAALAERSLFFRGNSPRRGIVMDKKFRVGIIGCGQIAKYLHVPDYARCPQAELVAFCDIDVVKARALAQEFAPDAQIFHDFSMMLKEMDLDGVSICTPNYLHGPATIAALKADCNVLVEKPMATSSVEAQKMVDAAKKAKRLLMVDQTQRLFPAHVKAKEVLDSGLMGKILVVNSMFGHSGPENWSPTGKWFFKKKEARFGAMADLGVHKADLIRFLTGKEVAEISGYMNRLEKKNSDVEDNFVSSFTFTDGTMGTLCASWTVKGCEANYTIFHCANGTLRVCEFPGKPVVAYLVNPQCEIEFPTAQAATNDDDEWGLNACGNFVLASLGRATPFCTGEDAKKSLDIILAAEKSALTGKSVKLNH